MERMILFNKIHKVKVVCINNCPLKSNINKEIKNCIEKWIAKDMHDKMNAIW
jgi:hypothetical protein